MDQSNTRAAVDKARVIGIYGLPGSGKSTVLEALTRSLPQEHFQAYEGSAHIDCLVPGGLSAFQNLDDELKTRWRELAIHDIQSKCSQRGQTALVTGHCMFWSPDTPEPRIVTTKADLETFTHVIYLRTAPETITDRIVKDEDRERCHCPEEHLSKWQDAEIGTLRGQCYDHGILFYEATRNTSMEKLSTLIADFVQHNEFHNKTRAEERLDGIMNTQPSVWETVLVFDGDRTMTPEDTGRLFFEGSAARFRDVGGQDEVGGTLTDIFSSPMGYSYAGLRTASLLYEQCADRDDFDSICDDVALSVSLYPEIVSFLHACLCEHVGAVIITSGLRCVWDRIVGQAGFRGRVNVIGGGQISDGFVVTPTIKAHLIRRLQRRYDCTVYAFGDSPMDLDMLGCADHGVVVVGHEEGRSTTMDSALEAAVAHDKLSARQVLLPKSAVPRLSASALPIVDLADAALLHQVRSHRTTERALHFIDATDCHATKLLMTQMRDAAITGPSLRAAHRRVGQYLTLAYLAPQLDVEEFDVQHVQRTTTTGYRVRRESDVLVVALMRGGEPMAFGVNDIIPSATFLHAKHPQDVEVGHLRRKFAIVLVDSVVNTGGTVNAFVRHIRSKHPTVRIVIVAGVVQAECVQERGILRGLGSDCDCTLIALRVSRNKYTGVGGTDTGNRLFNTTEMH